MIWLSYDLFFIFWFLCFVLLLTYQTYLSYLHWWYCDCELGPGHSFAIHRGIGHQLWRRTRSRRQTRAIGQKNTSLVLIKLYGSQDLKKSVPLGVLDKNYKTRFNFLERLRNWLNQEVIFFLHICAVMFEYHSGRSGCANKTSLQPIYLQQSMSRIPTMSQRLDQEWESECVICNWALIWQLFSAVTASSLFSPTD